MSAALGKPLIAVIDDESSLRTSLSRLLRLADFVPVGYPSAEAFLADDKHPQFSCLLLDVRLEGMSGLDLLRQLGAGGDHPPVMFITAFDDPEICAQATALGCAGFFRKTSPGANIIDAIRRVTRGHEPQPGVPPPWQQ